MDTGRYGFDAEHPTGSAPRPEHPQPHRLRAFRFRASPLGAVRPRAAGADPMRRRPCARARRPASRRVAPQPLRETHVPSIRRHPRRSPIAGMHTGTPRSLAVRRVNACHHATRHIVRQRRAGGVRAVESAGHEAVRVDGRAAGGGDVRQLGGREDGAQLGHVDRVQRVEITLPTGDGVASRVGGSLARRLISALENERR